MEIKTEKESFWLIGVFKRNKSVILFTVMLFGLCSIFVSWQKKQEYVSVSKIDIGMQNKDFFTSKDVLEPIFKKYFQTNDGELLEFDSFRERVKVFQKGTTLTLSVYSDSPQLAYDINKEILESTHNYIKDQHLKRAEEGLSWGHMSCGGRQILIIKDPICFLLIENPSLNERPVDKKLGKRCFVFLMLGVFVGFILAIGKELYFDKM